MALPITNLSLQAIQAEFGGPASPISLSSYYRGGANVPLGQGDAGYGLIPTAGTISFGPFRNQEKASVVDGLYIFAAGVDGIGPGDAYAAVVYDSDGTFTAIGDTVSPASGLWYDPLTPGIGSSYWIRISGTVGPYYTGVSTGTWHQLNAPRAFEWLSSLDGTADTGTVTIDISTSPTGTPIVATHTIEYVIDNGT